MKTEIIYFESVQTENRDFPKGDLPSWCARRESEAFRDMIRAVAFEAAGKMPDKILFSWEEA